MKAFDLFSGPGGLSLGLKRAGIDIAANVEWNRDAMATYVSHDAGAVHLAEDIRGISFASFRGKIDLVVGGPPCQPFSIGGLRKGRADARDMIPEFIRCLQEIQPGAFLMENVPGLMFKSALPYFQSLLARLAGCGYRLNWAVLNAADYGVPQKRRRLFILGARGPVLRFPAPSHGAGTGRPHVQALAALGPEPIGVAPNCRVKFAKYPDLRPSPYAGHVYNGGGRPLDPDGPCHTILASSGGYKTHWIDTQHIAPAYHAHLMAGGVPRQGEVPGARRLSVEECAIIQSFPRSLTFAGTRSSQYTQVGDAVPPDLAHVLGQGLMLQMGGGGDALTLAEPQRDPDFIQQELSL